MNPQSNKAFLQQLQKISLTLLSKESMEPFFVMGKQLQARHLLV